jgi:hypothetical protein
MNSHMLRHVPEELADNILQDGERLRVPVSMMDSTPRTVNGDGSKNMAAHRPGYRLSARDAKGRDWSCYDAYDKSIESESGFGSAPASEFRGDQPGDLCTVRGPEYPWDFGSPGHLDKNLVCVPDNPRRADDTGVRPSFFSNLAKRSGSATGADARSIRDRAYQDYEDDLTSAWKGPINEQAHGANTRPVTDARVKDTTAKAYADYDRETANAWKR